jgi:hypothetical protein
MAKMPMLMLAVAALLALGRPAETQQRSWPVRPVKLVVSTRRPAPTTSPESSA